EDWVLFEVRQLPEPSGAGEARGSQEYFPEFGRKGLRAGFLPARAENGKQQHRKKDSGEAERRGGDSATALREDREAAVNELDVNPIDEKRSLAELNERAEALLGKSPAAPGVHEEEIGAGVPVVVNGVEMDGGAVKQNGQSASENACGSQKEKREGFAALGKQGKEKETGGQTGESKRGPGEQREEPRLRLVENVHAVEIGLDGPGKKTRAVGSPNRRSQHGNGAGSEERGEDGTRAGRGGVVRVDEPAEDAHEDHGKAEDVEDVHAEEIGPGRPRIAEREFLDAEEEREAEDFGTAADGLLGDGVAGDSLFAEALGDESEGDAGEKDEKRRGERAAELRPGEERRMAGLGAEPGIITVRLEHHDAGEAAHPIDIGETLHNVE